MTKRSLYGLATVALVVAAAPPALAVENTVTITPGAGGDKTVVYQPAAPTRLFGVEKAVTLAPGERRVGANLQVGGLGTPAGLGLAGGVNVRADTNVSPGLEAGISATGLGGQGVANLLANLDVRGKLSMGSFAIGMVPVRVAGLADIGAMAAGGGIGSASLGLGLPLTSALTSNMNITLVPGLAFGFGAQNIGTPRVTGGPGFTPALGLGMDVGLTRELSAIIDGNLNYGNGFGATGNIGVRYGFGENMAADLFLGYNGNPLTNINAGTLGLGGYYAF